MTFAVARKIIRALGFTLRQRASGYLHVATPRHGDFLTTSVDEAVDFALHLFRRNARGSAS